jgi:GST-like protein
VISWVEKKGHEDRRTAFVTLEGFMDTTSKSVYSLGTANPTLVDVYISFVCHYSPEPRYGSFSTQGADFDMYVTRYNWLETNCPRIFACARETLKHPVLRKVFSESGFEVPLAEA